MNIKEYYDALEPELKGIHVSKSGAKRYASYDDFSYALNNIFALSKKSNVTLTYAYNLKSHDDRGGELYVVDRVYVASVSIHTKKGPIVIKIKDDPNLNVEDFIRSCVYLEKIANIYGKEALNLGPESTASDLMKVIEKYPLTDTEKVKATRAFNKETMRLYAIDSKADLKYKKQVLNLTKKQSELQKELNDTNRELKSIKGPYSRVYNDNEKEL